jgi:hypothetical protein
MDLKEAIYNTVLSNLHNKVIRQVYDKAITCVSPIENSSLTIYVRIYGYTSFSAYILTKISREVFEEIVGTGSFYIPVQAYGNKFSIGYKIDTVSRQVDYEEDFVTYQPNLDIYNKLMSYEREMLDGNTPRESNNPVVS